MYLTIDLIAEIKSKNFTYQSSSFIDESNVEKGYAIIDHAYEILKNKNDSLYLSDIVSNLRKAVNLRIKDLFCVLGVDNIKFPLGKDKKVEKLEMLGIVKPLLIKELILIRNGIEYDGENPPNQYDCQKLIDIVWYFYRSTDRYCESEYLDWTIEWEEDNKDYFLCIDFDFEKHETLKIFGRWPDRYVSKNAVNSTNIILNNFKFEDCSEKDKANGHINYHNMFYEAEIDVKNIDNYLELLCYMFGKFGK